MRTSVYRLIVRNVAGIKELDLTAMNQNFKDYFAEQDQIGRDAMFDVAVWYADGHEETAREDAADADELAYQAEVTVHLSNIQAARSSTTSNPDVARHAAAARAAATATAEHAAEATRQAQAARDAKTAEEAAKAWDAAQRAAEKAAEEKRKAAEAEERARQAALAKQDQSRPVNPAATPGARISGSSSGSASSRAGGPAPASRSPTNSTAVST